MQRYLNYKILLICVLANAITAQMAAGQAPIGSEFQVNTTTAEQQIQPRLAVDAAGNFVVVWAMAYDIYGQRYDSNGSAVGGQFHINTDMANFKFSPSVAADSAGNFVVVWTSNLQDGDNLGVFGQRFDDTGASVGLEFQVNTYTTDAQTEPDVAVHNAGSFVVVWSSDGQDGSSYGIYGQRFAATGSPTGPEFRVNSNGFELQDHSSVAIDSSGNFVVVWHSIQQDGDGAGVFRRRFTASGSPIGLDTQVNTYWTSDQAFPCVAMLPTGEHVVVWDSYGQDGNLLGVFGKRFDEYGTAIGSEFQVNSTTADNQDNARVAVDHLGGFTVVWESWLQDGSAFGVYGQRFLDDGTKFSGEYLVNTYTTQSQWRPDVAIGGPHQVVVWESVGQDGDQGGIFGQRFGFVGSGSDLRVSSFLSPAELTDAKQPIDVSVTIENWAVDDADSFRTSIRVSPDSTITTGDTLVTTVTIDELLAGADTTLALSLTLAPDVPRGDVYLGVLVDDLDEVTETDEDNNSAQNAFSYQVPVVYSVKDVHGDQGGWVFLKWYASPLDAVSAGGLITEYTLWRTIDIYGAAALASGEDISAAGWIGPDRDGKKPTVRVEQTPGGTIFWELAATHGAYHLDGYGSAVPTLFDSTAVNTDYHYFQVIAHTSDPLVYYISGIDSARSVDDLAPAQPLNLAGDQTVSPDGLELSWDPNSEPDLLHYVVYRGTDAGFVPSPGNQLGSTTEVTFFDDEWVWSSDYYYKVSAVDIHGNESTYADLGPGTVSDAGTPPALRTALEQNRPNPFNPATTIRFSLAEKTFVELTVFDARGRRVKTLVRAERTPDVYSVTWDGVNDAGAPVSSGVYFYRLEAGSFTQVKKMVLLK